jgi:hypothetical protein
VRPCCSSRVTRSEGIEEQREEGIHETKERRRGRRRRRKEELEEEEEEKEQQEKKKENQPNQPTPMKYHRHSTLTLQSCRTHISPSLTKGK